MRRKKTHEEYVKEINDLGLNVEVLEEYVNAQTKILHRCTTHNVEWYSLPNNILAGKGCPECRREKTQKKLLKCKKDYIEELKIKNPAVELVGDYCGARVKTLHHCTVHDVYWNALPTNILKGQGCSQCRSQKAHDHNPKKINQRDYEMRINESLPHIVVKGFYINYCTPITHYCKIHDLSWEATPAAMLRGVGCPECIKDMLHELNCKPETQYRSELSKIHPHIQLLGKYVDSNTKTLHRCNLHNIEWEVSPSNLLAGHGCRLCGTEKIKEKMTRTNDEYSELLRKIGDNIVALEPYITASTPILHRCKKHEVEWYSRPDTILQGCGCPECGKEKQSIASRKTHNDYLEILKEKNIKVVPMEEYQGSHTKILHRCLIDGYEWEITPSNLLSGFGCPICCQSKGERAVATWLDKHSLKYICEKQFDDCKDTRCLPFDFYLPEFNTCIEYDGKQHFFPVNFGGCSNEVAKLSFELTKKHDQIKNIYCQSNGIKLLRIKYDQDIDERLNSFFEIQQ